MRPLGLTLAVAGLEVATPFGDLLGPLGLTVALLTAVWFLVRILFKFIERYIADLEARVVDVTAQRDIAVTGWREQTAATNRLADAVEKLAPVVVRRRR